MEDILWEGKNLRSVRNACASSSSHTEKGTDGMDMRRRRGRAYFGDFRDDMEIELKSGHEVV